MSFQLSPQAIIFDIERQIEQLESKTSSLQLAVFNSQQALDEFNIRSPETTTNIVTLRRQFESSLRSNQNTLNNHLAEIESLKNQIPVLEADISGKIELNQVIDLTQLELILSNFSNQFGNFVSIPTTEIIQIESEKNNRLRNALIVGGVLLLII